MGRDFIRKGFSHEITPQRSATVFSFPTTLRDTEKYPLICACVLLFSPYVWTKWTIAVLLVQTYRLGR